MVLSIVDLPANEVVLPLPYLAKHIVIICLQEHLGFILCVESDPYIYFTQLRITLFMIIYHQRNPCTFIFCHFSLIHENPVPALWRMYGNRISKNEQYCKIFLYNVKKVVYIYIYIYHKKPIVSFQINSLKLNGLFMFLQV